MPPNPSRPPFPRPSSSSYLIPREEREKKRTITGRENGLGF